MLIRSNKDLGEVEHPRDLMQWINMVHRDLSEHYPLTRMEFQINLTAGSKSYALHASISSVQAVRYVYGTGEYEYTELEPSHLEELIDRDPMILQTETRTEPTGYYIEGDTINIIDPAPTTSATVSGQQIPRLEVDAYAYTALDEGDTLPVLLPDGSVYVYGAIRRYLETSISSLADKGRFEMRAALIAHFRQLEDEAIKKIANHFVGKADRFKRTYRPVGRRFPTSI